MEGKVPTARKKEAQLCKEIQRESSCAWHRRRWSLFLHFFLRLLPILWGEQREMGILDNKRRGKDCSLIQENKWGASGGARAVKELLYSHTYYRVLLPYLSDVFFHCWKPVDWINLLFLRSISWHIWIWACNKAFLLHSTDDIGTPLQTSRFLMHSPGISKGCPVSELVMVGLTRWRIIQGQTVTKRMLAFGKIARKPHGPEDPEDWRTMPMTFVFVHGFWNWVWSFRSITQGWTASQKQFRKYTLPVHNRFL